MLAAARHQLDEAVVKKAEERHRNAELLAGAQCKADVLKAERRGESDRRWCVDRYDAAARKFKGKPASELAWGTKIEYAGVMDLIEVDDVVERFTAFATTGPTQAFVDR